MITLFVLLFGCMTNAIGQVVIKKNQKVASYGLGDAKLYEQGANYFVMDLCRPGYKAGFVSVELGEKEQALKILTSLVKAAQIVDKDDEIILNNPSEDVAVYRGSKGTLGVKVFHLFGKYAGHGLLEVNAAKHFIKKLKQYEVNSVSDAYQYPSSY